MKLNRAFLIVIVSILTATGCETTSTVPYTASTENVLVFQNKLSETGIKVKLADFTESAGVEKGTCRLAGPVDVSPGKTQAQYIKEAMQTELFMAQVYDVNGNVEIKGNLDAVKFKSTSPASWAIRLSVSSDRSSGYTVDVQYPFKTSFSAYSACKNVADAWAPAVQKLIREVVDHPEFGKLAGLPN